MKAIVKERIKPALVLTVICLVGALLLSLVNLFTAPIIAAAEAEAKQASLGAVVENAAGFDSVECTPVGHVTEVYREREGRAYVFLLSFQAALTKGGTTNITVGIDGEGKICGLKMTANRETVPSNIQSWADGSYLQAYLGQSAAGTDGMHLLANATISSAALKESLQDAFALYKTLPALA